MADFESSSSALDAVLATNASNHEQLIGLTGLGIDVGNTGFMGTIFGLLTQFNKTQDVMKNYGNDIFPLGAAISIAKFAFMGWSLKKARNKNADRWFDFLYQGFMTFVINLATFGAKILTAPVVPIIFTCLFGLGTLLALGRATFFGIKSLLWRESNLEKPSQNEDNEEKQPLVEGKEQNSSQKLKDNVYAELYRQKALFNLKLFGVLGMATLGMAIAMVFVGKIIATIVTIASITAGTVFTGFNITMATQAFVNEYKTRKRFLAIKGTSDKPENTNTLVAKDSKTEEGAQKRNFNLGYQVDVEEEAKPNYTFLKKRFTGISNFFNRFYANEVEMIRMQQKMQSNDFLAIVREIEKSIKKDMLTEVDNNNVLGLDLQKKLTKEINKGSILAALLAIPENDSVYSIGRTNLLDLYKEKIKEPLNLKKDDNYLVASLFVEKDGKEDFDFKKFQEVYLNEKNKEYTRQNPTLATLTQIKSKGWTQGNKEADKLKKQAKQVPMLSKNQENYAKDMIKNVHDDIKVKLQELNALAASNPDKNRPGTKTHRKIEFLQNLKALIELFAQQDQQNNGSGQIFGQTKEQWRNLFISNPLVAMRDIKEYGENEVRSNTFQSFFKSQGDIQALFKAATDLIAKLALHQVQLQKGQAKGLVLQ